MMNKGQILVLSMFAIIFIIIIILLSVSASIEFTDEKPYDEEKDVDSPLLAIRLNSITKKDAHKIKTNSLGEGQNKDVLFAKKTSSDEIHQGEDTIGYYEPDSGYLPIGITSDANWKTGIRLTQDEFAPYSTWDLIGVNVFHLYDDAHNGYIEIYDEGNDSAPGPLITNGYYHFDSEGWFRVDLNECVPLNGHNELWVVVDWNTIAGEYPAAMDGTPAVDGKGDWCYLNDYWAEMQDYGYEFDHNWCMEAIVKGEGKKELEIGEITGGFGIKAEIITGNLSAETLHWSITLDNGLIIFPIGRVKEGTSPCEQHVKASIFVLGLRNIDITVFVEAPGELSATKTTTGFVFGPFVFITGE